MFKKLPSEVKNESTELLRLLEIERLGSREAERGEEVEDYEQ